MCYRGVVERELPFPQDFMGLFKSKKEKAIDQLVFSAGRSLHRQLRISADVEKLAADKGSADDHELFDERLRSPFSAGYVFGFIIEVLSSLDMPEEQRHRYVAQVVEGFFDRGGSRKMAANIERGREGRDPVFKKGAARGREDSREWREDNTQPKGLGSFLLRGE